ncbi:MAG: hypothetical protein HY708_02770 [Ignavibacteriae bacterium]|nr:hypothetical protein [Ignavibacteriota bacterium]
MPSFLVESHHTLDECVRVLQDLLAIGYLTHFDWGCKDGDHTGWAIIEAENKAEALMVVPSSVRARARVIQLTRFSPEEVKAMHTKE